MAKEIGRQRMKLRQAVRTGLVKVDPNKPIIWEREIASGHYGSVFAGKYDERVVALKKPHNGANGSQESVNCIDDFVLEATLLMEAAGPGVVKFTAACVDPPSGEPPYMILELLKFGSLRHQYEKRSEEFSIFNENNTDNRRQLQERNIKSPVLLHTVRIGRDIATAMAHIHSKGIVHLDLACRNVVLDGRKRPKIADFGLACRESDVLEIHSIITKKLKDLGDHATDKKREEECKKAVLNSESYDEAELRRYNGKDRPTQWMPDWAVAPMSAVPPHPLLDHHTDVYSFGCVLYEMVAFCCPHAGVSQDELRSNMTKGPFVPTMPPNAHPALARIMRACWSAYDSQPTMTRVANDLDGLYSELLSDSNTQEMGCYDEFRSLFTSKLVTQNSGYSYATYSTLLKSSANGGTASAAGAVPSDSKLRTLRGTGSKGAQVRILLFESPYVDLNVATDVSYYITEGIEKERFESALVTALELRDHITIATNMLCVRVCNDANQLDVICKCLEFIKQLCSDTFGSLEKGTEWSDLIVAILRLLKGALSAEVALSATHSSKLLTSAIGAVAAGLKCVDFVVEDSELPENFDIDIVNVLVHAIKQDSGNRELMIQAALAIDRAASLYYIGNDKHMKPLLARAGMVERIVEVLATHKTDCATALACVNALSRFSLAQLVEPTADQSLNAQMYTCEQHVLRWSIVFNSVIGVLEYYCRSNVTDDLKDELVVDCLLMLSTACEKQQSEPELVEKFMFAVTEDQITFLVNVAKSSTKFGILNGIFGVMKHVITTGSQTFFPDEIVLNDYDYSRETLALVDSRVQPLIDPARRLDALLKVDPSMDIFLDAMEKYNVDDKESMGIKRREKAESSGGVLSKGVYATTRRQQTERAGAFSYDNNAGNKGGYYSNKGGDIGGFEVMLTAAISGYTSSVRESLTVSAASLQRSVIVLLTFASSMRKELKKSLLLRRYNELILDAFSNFNRDPTLVKFGCHAIFSICRKSEMHQRLMKELGLCDVLMTIYYSHQEHAEVVDGVLNAFIGMLEPEDQGDETKLKDKGRDKAGETNDVANINTTTSAISATATVAATATATTTAPTSPVNDSTNSTSPPPSSPDKGGAGKTKAKANQIFERTAQKLRKQLTDSYSIVTTLAKPALLEPLAKIVAIYGTDPRNHYLVESFFKFVNCLIYWQPELLNDWYANLFLDLNSSKSKDDKTSSAQFELISRQRIKFEEEKFQRETGESLGKELRHREVEGFDNVQGDRSDELHLVKVSELGKQNLMGYALMLMKWNANEPHVVASGMSLLMNIFRHLYQWEEHPDEVPFNKIASLAKFRTDALTLGLINLCMQVKWCKWDDALAVRYSLWFMTIFISECRDTSIVSNLAGALESQHMAEAEKNSKEMVTGTSIATQVAAKLATKGMVEWAVRICYDHFPNSYAIQSVRVSFLVWMEHHGRMFQRRLQFPKLVQSLNAVSSRGVKDFNPLESEGHDTFVLDQDPLIFGHLAVNADRLLRLVEAHMDRDDGPSAVVRYPHCCVIVL